MDTLSVVIPVRNERDSIPPLLDKFIGVERQLPRPYRIIVVDGVSTDGTREAVQAYADRLPIELVALATNIGLGGALEVGLLRALKQPGAVVTMDGDDSHDPATIPALLHKLAQGYDVVVASRFEPGGEEIGVAGHRKLLSHAASGVLRLLFPVGTIKDYSSGFRAYRTDVLERLRADGGRLVNESGFSCMMELLLNLRARGARAAEVPLVLRYDLKRSPSKMDVGHTILRYLLVMGKHSGRVRGFNRPVRSSA